jgi:hypothetical protein
MNFAMSATQRGAAKKVRKVSDQELARFLRHLSSLYRDRSTGNPGLSLALAELADSIYTAPSAERQSSLFDGTSLNETIRNADSEMLNKIIMDEKLTKGELVRVARERFSIPRSKLLRMTIEGVRSELKSALLHEESLKIISQEAHRGGTNRVS